MHNNLIRLKWLTALQIAMRLTVVIIHPQSVWRACCCQRLQTDSRPALVQLRHAVSPRAQHWRIYDGGIVRVMGLWFRLMLVEATLSAWTVNKTKPPTTFQLHWWSLWRPLRPQQCLSAVVDSSAQNISSYHRCFPCIVSLITHYRWFLLKTI